MPHLRHISPAHSPPPTAHRPPPIQIPNHQQQQQTDKRNNHGSWFVGQRRHFPSEIDGWKLTITREMDRVIDSRPVSSAADRWLWFPRPRKSNFQVSAVQFWGDPISSHLNCCWLSYSWLPAIDSLIIEGRGEGQQPRFMIQYRFNSENGNDAGLPAPRPHHHHYRPPNTLESWSTVKSTVNWRCPDEMVMAPMAVTAPHRAINTKQ